MRGSPGTTEPPGTGRPTRAEALDVLRSAFGTVTKEHTELELPVRGRIPDGLEGVLYRNGPGRMERGGHAYGHLFDGDGHVCRFEFRAGRVRYTNRFVRTDFFRAEEAAGRVLFRSLGTNRPGGVAANCLRLRFKNAANTHVILHAGRLLALYEGGAPHELDPRSLETEGVWDLSGDLVNPFGGLSRRISPLLPFAAHPTVDASTGELLGFGLLPGRPNRLLTYRVDGDGRCLERRTLELGASSFVHDALVTERWWVFLLPQVDYGLLGVLGGTTTPAGSMALHTDRPMELLLVPRAGGEPVRFEAFPGFVFHFAGGGEHADGSLHAYVVHHDRLPALAGAEDLMTPGEGLGRLLRLDIDPTAGTVRGTRLSEHAHELPRVGARGRRIFSCGVAEGRDLPFYSAILGTDPGGNGSPAVTRLRDFLPDLPGEPVPVEAGGATWLLVLVYRAGVRRTDLLILDGEDLATVAEIELPHGLPPGFHGSWVDAEAAAP